MEKRILTEASFKELYRYLYREEKSAATIEKYRRDVRCFYAFANGVPVSKELVAEWKKHLIEQGYAPRSVNSMLASVNSLLKFMGWEDCRVKNLRVQRRVYCAAERELDKQEYMRLLQAARGRPLQLVMQTICATGIRVSELRYFTVEAVQTGEICVNCKGKSRSILLPTKLRKMLLSYARKNGIGSGAIFLGRTGRPLDRSAIWAAMKQLCQQAGVAASKVFPHNLRKLFARTFYKLEKDIAKLADILGHGNIETTRIYIMSSGREHRQKIERLGLMV